MYYVMNKNTISISAKAVTGGPPFSRFVYVRFTLYVILRTCKHVGADYEFNCYFFNN